MANKYLKLFIIIYLIVIYASFLVVKINYLILLCLIINILYNFLMNLEKSINGDWGLGIGDWGLGIGPNAQLPIAHAASPLPNYSATNSNMFLKFKYI